jgi:hypothetical protein
MAWANVARKMERETDFITRSGKQGILAVELRRGAGKTRTAHLVPWGQIFQSCNAGKAGVSIREKEGRIQDLPAGHGAHLRIL